MEQKWFLLIIAPGVKIDIILFFCFYFLFFYFLFFSSLNKIETLFPTLAKYSISPRQENQKTKLDIFITSFFVRHKRERKFIGRTKTIILSLFVPTFMHAGSWSNMYNLFVLGHVVSCWNLCCMIISLMKGQMVVCPVTLRRKEREYWWVSRSLMTARKITLVLWVRTWKKTVAIDRARMKHLTLKFRGPVDLGGMNKWWKNELQKEHWPKSWMCSSHVVMVCYSRWNRQEESVKKRVGLSCSKNMWGRERDWESVCVAFYTTRENHPSRMA